MLELFVHPQRVDSPREAAALVRQLGVDRVRLTQHRTRSWRLKDPASIQRVVSFVEASPGTMIEYEGITRESTLPVIEQLVTGDAEFVSIAGNGAWLRVWPRRNEAFVDQLAIDRSHAFERFRPTCTLTWINGSVSEPGPDIVACLPRLFGALDQPEVEFDLDLPLDAALSLVLEFPDDELEWTGPVVIRFPDGEIMTYQLKPAPDFEDVWRERIATALAAIR